MKAKRFCQCLTTVLLVVFALLSVRSAYPQAASGTITGTVFDPSGAVVPKANVLITNVERGVDYRSQSTNSGLYEARFLPPGAYSATAEAQGFKKAVKTGLVLVVGQTMRVDFNLEVGAIAQEVQVQGDVTQLLKPETSEVGQIINLRQVVDLPLNGRNFRDLIPLNAGVGTGQQHASNTGYNFNGSRSDMNMFMIEGVDNVDMNSNLMLSPSIDAIEEFQIQTGNFSAEYGRSSGGVVQVQLRSGSNKIHGTLFEFLRNDKMDANGFFQNMVPCATTECEIERQEGKKPPAPKEALKRNQFGFSLGGPIKKNKLFFFGDYQGSRQRRGRSGMLTVPTAKERIGDFTETLANGVPIYKNALWGSVYPGCDMAHFTRATCQVIPTTGPDSIDPPAAAVAAMYPLPNMPGVFVEGTGTYNNYFASGSSADDGDNFDVKMDYRLREQDSFSFRYSYGNGKSFSPAAFGGGTVGPCINCGVVMNLLAGSSGGRTQNMGLTYIHTFSPTTVNEFRAGLNRSSSFFHSNDNGAKLADQVGIANVNVNDQTSGLPWFYMVPAPDWIGTSPFEPYRNGYTVYQFTDNLSHFAGKHRIKAGFDLRRRLNNGVGNFFGKGDYIFIPLFTGNAFGDFMTGRGTVIGQDFTPGTTGLRGMDYGFYVQDDIKVTPRLTLNLGLRYELFPGFVEVHDRLSNLNTGDGGSVMGFAELAGLNGAPRQFIPTDKNNFAPRFGFAWTPFANGKTVIRGGYGISYFNSGNFISYSGLNPPYTGAFSVPFNICGDYETCGSRFYDAQYFLSDGLPIQLRPTPETFDTQHPNGSWRMNSPDQRSPYSQYFSLGIQRALPWDLMLDISYVGSRGVKLPGENQGDPILPGDPNTANSRHIYQATIPNVSDITLYANQFNSNYHSLQVKAVKRFSHGLQFLGTYTYGKSIDDKSGSAVTGGGDSNPDAKPQDPFNIASERARSSFDQTHRFILAYNYDLPVGRGRKFGSNWHPVVNAFLGGWQANGIFTLATGLPFSVFAAMSGAGCGCTSNDMRADRLANGNLPKSQRNIRGWFDKTAFAEPPSTIMSGSQVVSPGRWGNSARNIIYGPGFANVDFSLFKKFSIKEKAELQFRGEFFNIANNVNYYYPTSKNNATWNTGGLITQAHDPRIIQLALKLVF